MKKIQITSGGGWLTLYIVFVGLILFAVFWTIDIGISTHTLLLSLNYVRAFVT